MKLVWAKSPLIFCLLFLSLETMGQKIYFGVTGTANTSYLRNRKYTFFHNAETSRKQLYYPGGQVGIRVGMIPLKKDVSPIFEFSCYYIYRKFGQEWGITRTVDSPSREMHSILNVNKNSNDFAFSFKAGVVYKGWFFLTGPSFERFLIGKVFENTNVDGVVNHVEYTLSRTYFETRRLKFGWLFETGYTFNLPKNFSVTPFVNYGLIKYNNILDTSFGWVTGHLSYASLGVTIGYSLNLKKRKDGVKR